MHWLTSLLNPGSIAVVGASDKADSLGGKTLRILQSTGFAGALYPVNPRYQLVGGIACYESLPRLPVVPDLAVFAVAGQALERSFDEAIERGVRAAVIYANSYVAGDAPMPLLERLKSKARRAGIPVCGGNGMGYQNHDANTMVSFDRPLARPTWARDHHSLRTTTCIDPSRGL